MADSFQLAYLIPNTIYEFIAGGLLSAVFIPLLVKEQEESRGGNAQTWQVANLLLGAVGVVLGVVSLIAILGSPWIIQFMTMMGDSSNIEEKKLVATYLFRYFAPQILFLGINAIFMAILNSQGVFAITAAAPIINNLFCIAAFLGYYYGWVGIAGLAVITTLGTVSMALVQLPFILKSGMSIRPMFKPRHPVFKSVSQLGWPVLVVSIANLVGWSVRSNLLNTVLGSFAIYTFCFQIIMMPYGIFAVSIATVLFPTLTRHAANKHEDAFVDDMGLGFRWTTFIMLPISLGIAVLSMPIVRVLFEHRGGLFTFSDSLFASNFLAYYALSIAPYALLMFATRVFYSLNNTLTPAIINIVGVGINIGLSIVLLREMGAAGIALAASVTYLFTTAASMYMIKFSIRRLGGQTLWLPLVKILAASLLMSVVVYSAERWTRSQVVVLEKGTRLPITLPINSRHGGFIQVRSSNEFEQLWKALGRKAETTPPVDFARNQLVLAWAPAGYTTTSMELGPVPNIVGRTIKLPYTVYKTSSATSTTLEDQVSSSSYSLVQVASPATPVEMDFTVSDGKPADSKRLVDPEILRLFALVVLGAFVYVVSAWVLRIGELETFFQLVKRKVFRRSSPPE